MPSEAGLVELRCPNDDKLLLKVSDIEGVEIEIKCARCGELVVTKRVADDEN